MITPNVVPTNRLCEHMTVIERCETIGNNPDTLLTTIIMADTQQPSTVKLPSQNHNLGINQDLEQRANKQLLSHGANAYGDRISTSINQVLPIQTNFLLNTMVAKP